MYDQIYMNPEPDKEKKEEKVEASFKDILAMTIAAYQIIFVPFAIFVLILIIFYFLFKLMFVN